MATRIARHESSGSSVGGRKRPRRHSGLQKEVLALYKDFFKAAREMEDVESSEKLRQAVRDEFRSNRLPIALAAVAGTLWLLREPIKEHAPRLARRIQNVASDLADRLRPATADAAEDIEQMEEDDEALR